VHLLDVCEILGYPDTTQFIINNVLKLQPHTLPYTAYKNNTLRNMGPI
jgi:hypothetical protein